MDAARWLTAFRSLARSWTRHYLEEWRVRGMPAPCDDQSKDRAEHYWVQRHLYQAQLNLVHNAWQNGERDRLLELLDQLGSEHTGNLDLRSFEWHYWQRRCRAGILFPQPEGKYSNYLTTAFSPDGKRLAAGAQNLGEQDGVIRIWDVATGHVLRTIKPPPPPQGIFVAQTIVIGRSVPIPVLIRSLTFSPNGRQLASGGDGGTVKVWDADTGQNVLTIQATTASVTSVVFSPDGQRLAVGSQDDPIPKIWDARTGKEFLALKGHKGGAVRVLFAPDGKLIISIGKDNSVKVWDAQTGALVRSIARPLDDAHFLAISPDGKRLASSGKGTVFVWSIEDGKDHFFLSGHTPNVSSVAFSPDGQWLATSSGAGWLRLWDAATGREVAGARPGTWKALVTAGAVVGARDTFGSPVAGIHFSLDSQRLAGAAWGNVMVCDIAGLQGCRTVARHKGAVSAVAFDPDGRRLACASGMRVWNGPVQNHYESAEINIYDMRSTIGRSELLMTLRGHEYEVMTLAFSPDGHLLASADPSWTVTVWDVRTGKKVFSRERARRTGGVAFSPDGKRLQCAGTVWETNSGQEVFTLNKRGDFQPTQDAAFSHDGKLLVTADVDRLIKVWDAFTGEKLQTVSGSLRSLDQLALSPDGKRVASLSYPDLYNKLPTSELKVWDLWSGKPVLTLKGHTENVRGITFSPDGRRLASDAAKQVKIWDALTGQEVLTLDGPTAPLNQVTFSRDGYLLAGACADGTVWVWDATPLAENTDPKPAAGK